MRTAMIEAQRLVEGAHVRVGRFRTRRVTAVSGEYGTDSVAFLLKGERFYRYVPPRSRIEVKR